jgi:peptidoglycan/xylan/chitin deacetylase (PgdA/CDA1 family)
MMALLLIILIPVLILAWLTLEYSLLIPAPKGLRILMYHRISEVEASGLSVTREMFEKQLAWLKKKKYQALTFAELGRIHQSQGRLPHRSVILTFDDAYEDFAGQALPLIEKYGFKATVFVPVAFMGKTNIWDKGSIPILSPEKLRDIAACEAVEIGIHSFLHRSYGEMNLEDMQEDLSNSTETLSFHKIPFVPVLAYPYGGYPKKDKLLKEQMKQLFRERGLTFALRIGNRINAWPLKEPYELKRIDIKGTDNFTTFTIKLRKGRKKLFS